MNVPGAGVLAQEVPSHGLATSYHSGPEIANGRSAMHLDGPLRLKGYMHMFSPSTSIKLGFPNFYRKPGLGYQKISQHRHRDIFDRKYIGDYDDRYISSYDGKISKLVVQAVDDIYENNKGSTYRRTFIRNVAPMCMRIANWPFNHIDYTKNEGHITSEDMSMLCLKWIITSCIITLFISSPRPFVIDSRNGGCYDEVPYKFFGYPKVSRNMIEMDRPRSHAWSNANPVARRLLRPRYLCFLRAEGKPALVMNVEDWMSQQSNAHDLSYIFVAYTAEQFQTRDCLKALHEMADLAARRAGVLAYWIGCSCMPDDQLQDDVYRICDVVRGAHSLMIAVARPPNDKEGTIDLEMMLQQLGSRLWTFPEILLAPAGKDITVYVRSSSHPHPRTVAKNQIAAQVWKSDAHVARQLIDHYEGNLILTQIELVTLAVECLHKRDTVEYLPGDHSYALMGLLRVRPDIDPTDSAFQAFARLSLANDSNQLLERLICVLPETPFQPWHAMDDAYGAKLWDILPQDVSVASVGEDDSVILDGCRAANVRWKSFQRVAHVRKESWKRFFARIMLRSSGIMLLVAIFFSLIPWTRGLGTVLLMYSLIFIGLSPWLLRRIYLGKFWDQQCSFFGFEGYMDLDTIECQIFGGKWGRMNWTVNASPLSRHHRNEHNECIADDPTSDPEVAALVQKARGAGPGQQRVFTLVDTGNMTATLFLAERPPVCFLMAGSEGGMKRIIGCSYDWTTATMYRETVLRIGTEFENQMARIGRVKIGFNRKQHPVGPLDQVGEPCGHQYE